MTERFTLVISWLDLDCSPEARSQQQKEDVCKDGRESEVNFELNPKLEVDVTLGALFELPITRIFYRSVAKVGHDTELIHQDEERSDDNYD